MVNKKYKDTLFRIIFHNTKNLLSLYNALNSTHYTNENDIILTTLDGAIYLGYRNDLSYLIQDTLFLYEHQSTKNPNMPLRGVIYFSALYQAYVTENEYDIYGSALVPLPVPQFIVFYNGMQNAPERWTTNLSDAFIQREKRSNWALECTAEYININFGHNKELMDACRILWEYSYFIQTVRDNLRKGHTLEKAAHDAMKLCIEQDILKDILERNRNIMVDLLREYDLDFHIRSEKKLSYNEGLEEGLTMGSLNKLKELVEKKLQKGKTADEIADILEEDVELILTIIENLNQQ